MNDNRIRANDDPTTIASQSNPGAEIAPGLSGDTTQLYAVGGEIPFVAPPGYEVLAVLGRGGMGVVYRARQISLNRVVALKTIMPGPATHVSAAARFEQEAQTIARLQHPHIVAAFDFGQHEGRLFLAMELVEGEDVDAYIHGRQRLDEATTWNLIRQAAMGLAHAASQGVVHRDVKPANMLLVPPPEGFPLPPGMPLLKLTDFGLAFLAGDRRDSRLTQEGTTLGSPHYMAPEQIAGAAVDLRTDIYGLGATAYHMLTGQPPFPGENAGQVFANKVKGITPPVESLNSNVSRSTLNLLKRMMDEQPAKRPQSYAELLEDVDAIVEGKRSLGRGRSVVARRGGRQLRRFWWVPLVLLIAAGLIALSLVWRPSERIAIQPLVPTGRAMALFDGTSLSGWLPTEGQWLPGVDAEGGRVIRGTGVLRRILNINASDGQPWKTYRFTVGCDLQKASAAELQFGFGGSRDNGAGRSRLALRVEKRQFQLGSRAGDDAPFVSTAERARANSANSGGVPEYVELRIERHRGHWVTFVDGEPFSALATDAVIAPNISAPEIRLIAEGGEAMFDAPTLTELRSVNEPARRP